MGYYKASSDLPRRIFAYYKEIAKEISVKTDTDKNILGDYYDGIQHISEDAILTNFLEQDLGDNHIVNDISSAIFPFSFNQSQYKAVNNALGHKLSIIEGPPGTGKTQTILNIIANVVIRGQSVAVVSNNNSATDNVFEKLQSYGLDFMVARLGNSNNKKDFFASQMPLDKELLSSWKIIHGKSQKRIKVRVLANKINQLLERQIEIAQQRDRLAQVQLEQRHFAQTYDSANISRWDGWSSYQLLALWARIERSQIYEPYWWKRLLNWLRNRWWLAQIRDGESIEQILLEIQATFYQKRIKELERKIDDADELASELSKLMLQHQELSLEIFRDILATKYLKQGRSYYEFRDLWRHSASFAADYPVILSTTYSLRHSLSPNYVYDYIVIDEASQVDLATFALAMSCARCAVIVGDEKQLPNVVTTETQQADKKIFEKYDIPECFKFSESSALSSIRKIFGDNVPEQLLREHYRCDPQIIGFCNQKFYGGELVVMTQSSNENAVKVYETVVGNHARSNHVNQRQIDVTLREIPQKEHINFYDGSVGVVAPYRSHATELQTELNLLGASATIAATVDKFQGRERDTIIINTVDNQISDFASNPNRLNVAVSRAKKRLIVVTNGNHNSKRTGVDDLVDYIKYRSGGVEKSMVRSTFDYLYREYYNVLRIEQKTAYYSENLIYDLLKKLLQDEKYAELGCLVQYPLRYLCDVELTEREAQYAQHRWTKVDFLFYRKISKRPVGVIEVDGWRYHYGNSRDAAKQQERDRLKDAILYKAGLPVLRLPTNGSGERRKIEAWLDELC